MEVRSGQYSMEYRPNPDKWPCADQTAEQVESYYRGVAPGDPVCVRETQYGILRYYMTTVERIGHQGRIYPVGFHSFWPKGANCWEPKGQCKLVVPTQEVRQYAEAHPADPSISDSSR